jgi:hypothetical protein
MPALQLDSGPPRIPVARYLENELRFRMIEKSDTRRFLDLQASAQLGADLRWQLHTRLATPLAPTAS